VVALVQAGARLGPRRRCSRSATSPRRLPEHREFLQRHGHHTTLSYLRAMCALTVAESSLLPHANPGLMGERDLAALREVNVSMGIMLENVSERLLGRGLAHDNAPDKVPARRLRTIGLAGKLGIPFTTGILIGIGETPRERVDALLAIRDLHERWGHIQEVIVQNFRPSRASPCARRRSRRSTTCSARWPSRASSSDRTSTSRRRRTLRRTCYPQLLAAGLNDWGGISPLTPDHINPRSPWPGCARCDGHRSAGLRLSASGWRSIPSTRRAAEFLDERLRPRVDALIDADGLVRKRMSTGDAGSLDPALDASARRPRHPGPRLDGAEVSVATRECLAAPPGATLSAHARRRRAAPAARRRHRHLRGQPQHQLHQRLHQALRLLRLLPRIIARRKAICCRSTRSCGARGRRRISARRKSASRPGCHPSWMGGSTST
jgi:FO synthase